MKNNIKMIFLIINFFQSNLIYCSNSNIPNSVLQLTKSGTTTNLSDTPTDQSDTPHSSSDNQTEKKSSDLSQKKILTLFNTLTEKIQKKILNLRNMWQETSPEDKKGFYFYSLLLTGLNLNRLFVRHFYSYPYCKVRHINLLCFSHLITMTICFYKFSKYNISLNLNDQKSHTEDKPIDLSNNKNRKL